ncbi:putative sugar kinase in cluster with indigoidine synthase indA, PfkB family of kinase [Roseibacterium elongatum DSM 19469]|uniref:Putative sugar kinase in cluster with indigoidine synthase indA, PfkB family of kinase n=1 Tax=Roseicyclus elongatus DSM 19469 TaxID=1294273 RepID=W8SRQ9_9RHOB|nr:PfkB family carbohydrate kinase [Roseibacterium elongatum]AHM05225.1 putative sugar kinase in cluster with indigoidine synthase indA, PfkB family of kinase [Roseibacterium elongatum DSM 19469]
MSARPDILCIGSVLWDVIGRSDLPMVAGNDKPGRITRLPGGVALNIAMTLRRFDLTPALISVVGDDPEGRDLMSACGRMGLMTQHMLVDADLPTDRYMAIEAQGALIAALADAHSLEAAGARILAPLGDGRLGTPEAPWTGPVAIDGNLTEAVLAEIAVNPVFAAADLRLAPASPGKAERLRPLIGHLRATLYVNLEEAALLTGQSPRDARTAAQALIDAGAHRALVTEGGAAAACADADGCRVCTPPAIDARRITGAGDTFMAAHIAAELRGIGRADALQQAVLAAAAYVAGDDDD